MPPGVYVRVFVQGHHLLLVEQVVGVGAVDHGAVGQ